MKKKGKIPGRYHKTLKEQVRENPRLAAVYVILRVLVVLALVAQVFNGNFENVFLCVLTLILFTIPSFIERTIRIDIPDTLEIIILLFIFAAEILGEIQAYYVQFPYWDTMLHTLNGFLCAAIGFSLLDILNRDERLAFKLSPVYLAVVAFCFSMTIGVLWEFFECFMDQMFLLDMQKDTIVHSIGSVMLDPAGGNTPVAIHDITDVIVVTADGAQHPLGLGGYLDIGILDTMKDLFVNFIGAVVFSFIGYFYVKNRGKGWFAKRFIPKVLPESGAKNNRIFRPQGRILGKHCSHPVTQGGPVLPLRHTKESRRNLTMNKTPNNSIKCSVNSCAYHCGEQNYCTLNEIKVGCCDSNVTNCASTECASFQLGDHGGCCKR